MARTSSSEEGEVERGKDESGDRDHGERSTPSRKRARRDGDESDSDVSDEDVRKYSHRDRYEERREQRRERYSASPERRHRYASGRHQISRRRSCSPEDRYGDEQNKNVDLKKRKESTRGRDEDRRRENSSSPERKQRGNDGHLPSKRRRDDDEDSFSRDRRDDVDAEKHRESTRDRADDRRNDHSSSPGRQQRADDVSYMPSRDGRDDDGISFPRHRTNDADRDGHGRVDRDSKLLNGKEDQPSSPDRKHRGDERHSFSKSKRSHGDDDDDQTEKHRVADCDRGRWSSSSHRDGNKYNGKRWRHDSSSPERRPRSQRKEDDYFSSRNRRHRDSSRSRSSLEPVRDKNKRNKGDFDSDTKEQRRDRLRISEDEKERERSSRRHYDDDKRSKYTSRRGVEEPKEIAMEDAGRNLTSKSSSQSTEAHAAGKENKPLNNNIPDARTEQQTQGRSGGVYIPPFKLAQMMKEIQDKSSVEYQRMTWDALRKSINGLVNKVNASNIKNIIPELLAENLIRGRGLFARSCMKSQMASPLFTHVFAALVAVVNTKFPELGELLLKRIILQFRRAFRRNDKPLLLAAARFIAHLVNQQVAHEVVALELLMVLLENPTDDSVEVAVGFVKECGAILQDLAPQGLYGIFERFRAILHEGEIDKRVQFMIEGLFAIRKSGFQDYPAVRPELDLVEQEDQFTHEISLSDDLDAEMSLDIFKPDANFLEAERKYEEIKKDILGESTSDEEDAGESGSGESSDDGDDEEEEEEMQRMKIRDETETNLVNLRRTIYLTIMSSIDFEEAGHKLLKIKLEPGQEMELNIMLLECCSQERTYLRYYGLLGQRFCMINNIYQKNFDTCFVKQYSMIHRLETNKLRNVAKFFAHLLGTDALPWTVLEYIKLTEEDTTSSSRIFIKILFQELSEHLGLRKLNEKLNDPEMQESFKGIFPKDNPKDTRFAINFFTSIGLGGITDSLREHLKNMPRLIMQQQRQLESDSESESGSSSESYSGTTSDSDSGSESESETESSSESDSSRRKRRK
ncbi:hypothetical protein KP509_1Z119600 [Ceratopteris richardii]|nr:hypothetical protein KP509_1Z119600 [Ceratopteris richardii]